MGIASKYNKIAVFKFTIPKDFGYRNLNDLFESFGKNEVYKINGIYMNTKSRFGESPVVATDDYLVNLPQHLTETCKQMMADEECVTAINDGKLGFTIYPYEKSGAKEIYYSVNWVDM